MTFRNPILSCIICCITVYYAHRLQICVNGTGLTETYVYSDGKLKSVTYSDLSGTQPPALSYEYNANGYMTHIKSGGTAIKIINSKNSFGMRKQKFSQNYNTYYKSCESGVKMS
jgi:hypothetical protein